MALIPVTPPVAEPIALADAKLQCHIDGTDEDTLIASFIAAARAKAEKYTGTAIMQQTWDQTLDAFPPAEIELLKPPVSSIVSVSYVDLNGATQTLSSALYTLDTTFPGWLLPAYGTNWPATLGQANAIVIRYVTGYASAAAVPADMAAWLRMTISTLNTNRDSFVFEGKVMELPSRFVDSLLDPYRVFKA